MKKAVAKTKKVMPASSKKNSTLFLVSALAVSLFILVVVLMAMGSSQDNRSDAAGKTPTKPKTNLFKNAGQKNGPANIQPKTDSESVSGKKGAQNVEIKPYVESTDNGARRQ